MKLTDNTTTFPCDSLGIPAINFRLSHLVNFPFPHLQNEDPLKRIQQEINEVKQRELELRNQLRYDKQQLSPASSGDQKSQAQQNSDDSGISTTSSSPINGTSANRSIDLDSSPTSHSHRFVDHNPEPAKQATPKKKLPTSNPTYVRSTSAAAFVFAPRNPKPALPVEYYVKPQPVKATAARAAAQKSSQHNMLTRTVSTPQLFHSVQHKVPARGFMQRFIETRGKMGSAGAAKVRRRYITLISWLINH